MTDRLYYADSYLTAFTARVVERLEVNQRPAVVLDRSAFHPEGGGQPADRGALNQVRVVDVASSEDGAGAVLHVLAAPLAEDEVSGFIDWARRFDLMQQHTGQHILSQAFIRTAGAETVAFHLNDDPVNGSLTIDVNRINLTPSQVEGAEDLANQIVSDNRTVSARFVARDQLASIPLRRPPKVDGPIRVVEIGDFDASACGGTHVARTGEVGQIKIIKRDRRGDETRVEFRCGRRALMDYRRKNEMVTRVAADLSISFWELDQAVARLSADKRALFKRLEEADARLLAFEARELLAEARQGGGCAVVLRAWHDGDMNALRKTARILIARPKTVALLGSGGENPALVFARSGDASFDMNRLVREAAAQLGGRGGGSPDFAQAGGPAASVERVAAVLEWAFEQLRAYSPSGN